MSKFSLVSSLALVCLVTSANAAGSKVVLGKLAQTTTNSRIFTSPSPRARVYYKVKPYEYLVVKPSSNGKWVQVLMENRRYGFIPKSDVVELPYEVSLGASQQRPMGSMASRSGMANYALNFVGTPYKWGGDDENSGIDCSGFVKKMYGKIGLSLPRTAAEQATVGQKITRLEDLQPGDRLYFYEKKRNKIGHTGIYLGNGMFVHSSRGHRGVATDFLSAKWRSILVDARR